jgi:hypothetical protein
VAPITVSGAIGVVFEKVDRASRDSLFGKAFFCVFDELLKNSFAGPIMANHLINRIAFRSGIFRM